MSQQPESGTIVKLGVSSGVHMNKIDCGKNVTGIAKSLKQFKAGDPHIAAFFSRRLLPVAADFWQPLFVHKNS